MVGYHAVGHGGTQLYQRNWYLRVSTHIFPFPAIRCIPPQCIFRKDGISGNLTQEHSFSTHGYNDGENGRRISDELADYGQRWEEQEGEKERGRGRGGGEAGAEKRRTASEVVTWRSKVARGESVPLEVSIAARCGRYCVRQ